MCAGVCADSSELVNDVIRSVCNQQQKPFDVTPELEAWLLEAADKPVSPLTQEDFDAIRQRVRARHPPRHEPDMKVSLHPAQAVAKPSVSGAGFHDGFSPGFMAMDSELFEERTFIKVSVPVWIERIGFRPDFHVTPDFGLGGINQLHPKGLPLPCALSGVRRKPPFASADGLEVTNRHPSPRFFWMSASGP